jgi:hypothetical protein
MISSKPLCIFHGNCQDGFGAAWVVRKYFDGEVEFHAGVYNNAPPKTAGRNLIIVDFSYKKDVMTGLLTSGDKDQASTMLILDHHESAIDSLTPLGLEAPESGNYDPDLWRQKWESWGHWPVRAVFDNGRSGAMLAWNFFFPGKAAPRMIQHIQDRDLWRFHINGTREISAALFSHPYNFELWDELAERCDNPARWAHLHAEGAAIERKHHKDVEELTLNNWRKMIIGGYVVPVANLPYTLTSDAGAFMCKGLQDSDGSSWLPPFAACYWDTPEGRVFSLSSPDPGTNVAEIASLYRGGGHAHALGFRMPIGWEGDKPEQPKGPKE